MKTRGLFLLSAGFVAGICATGASASLLQRARLPDAVVASPGQYKVEFENDFVRVLRVTFGPHAKMVMHQHPEPGGVIVTVTDQDALITAPDGTSREVKKKPSVEPGRKRGPTEVGSLYGVTVTVTSSSVVAGPSSARPRST